MNHTIIIQLLIEIKQRIEKLMLCEIAQDTSIPKNVTQTLCLLHSFLSDYKETNSEYITLMPWQKPRINPPGQDPKGKTWKKLTETDATIIPPDPTPRHPKRNTMHPNSQLKYIKDHEEFGMKEKLLSQINTNFDYNDYAILYFLFKNTKDTEIPVYFIEGKKYHWISYNYIIANLPLLRIKTRQGIRKRFIRYVKCGLIEYIYSHEIQQNSIFYLLTEKAKTVFSGGL